MAGADFGALLRSIWRFDLELGLVDCFCCLGDGALDCVGLWVFFGWCVFNAAFLVAVVALLGWEDEAVFALAAFEIALYGLLGFWLFLGLGWLALAVFCPDYFDADADRDQWQQHG